MISEMIVVSSSILLNRFYRWSFHTTRLQNDTKVRRLKTIPLTNPYVERLTSWWGGGGEHILSRGGHLHFRTMENRIFLSSYTIFKQEMYVVSWHFSAKNWYVVTIGNSNCNSILDIKFDSPCGGIRNCNISVMYNDLKMDDRQKHQSDFFLY